MLPTASSTMGFFRFGIFLLLLICCVISVTSYRLEHRPTDERKSRAVTEWRFRRNYLFSLPYIHENFVRDDMDGMENENDSEGYGKNYVPHITYDG